jgi:mlo protein
MLLGFISLLLTFGTKYVAKICIPSNLGNIMLPCKKAEAEKQDSTDDRRRLLSFDDENFVWRRSLAAAAGGDDYCSKKVSHVTYINKTYIQFMHLFNYNNSMFL